MFTYINIFIVFFTISSNWNRFSFAAKNLFLLFAFFTIFFLIGFKYDVGTDSGNYLHIYRTHLYEMTYLNLYNWKFPEISYAFLNILSIKLNGGMLLVYIISGFIISCSIIAAVMISKVNPFLYLALIWPSYIVMLSVSGIRQGIAGALIILAYSLLLVDRKLLAFSAIIFATTFHSSSIIFLSLFVIGMKKKYIALLSPILIFVLLYFSLVVYGKYLDSDMSNIGLVLRYGFFVCVSFVIFITIFRANVEMSYLEKYHSYYIFAFLTAIGGVSILSSTLADRLSFYLITIAVIYLLFIIEKYKIYYQLNGYMRLLALGSFTTLIIFGYLGNNSENYIYDNYFYRYLVDGEFPKIDSGNKLRGGYLPSSAEPY